MNRILYFFLIISLPSFSQTFKFDEIQDKLDTNQSQFARGCQRSYVKILDSTHVLRIIYNVDIEYDYCNQIKLDSNSNKVIVYLEIFNLGKANTSNHCSCIQIVDLESPIKKVKSTNGKITICKSDPTNYYGNIQPKITILAEDLIFLYQGKEIIITKEVFWKILDLGTAG